MVSSPADRPASSRDPRPTAAEERARQLRGGGRRKPTAQHEQRPATDWSGRRLPRDAGARHHHRLHRPRRRPDPASQHDRGRAQACGSSRSPPRRRASASPPAAGSAAARAMIAMQSSGVGNCINALGLPTAFRAPCLMLVTMRGQWGEFNPWQVPMGQATQAGAGGRRRQVLPGRQGRGGRRDLRGRRRHRLQQPRERGRAGQPAHHRRQGVRTEMSTPRPTRSRAGRSWPSC